MDEKIEKAFEVVNYMATLSNQRRLLAEEIDQKLIYYINGSTFKITPTLINFAKLMIDLKHTTDAVFIDDNNNPVVVEDVKKFFEIITKQYFEVTETYSARFLAIKSKRKISDLIDL
jgi:thiamine phosphate synthase YjbQ (UPF0047 family)